VNDYTRPPKVGVVEVITGCMFSGKTEELLRRLRRAMHAKLEVVTFKPVIDDRYHAKDIVSHGGVTLKAIPIENPGDMIGKSEHAAVVGIDEAHFFGEGVLDAVQRLARDGRRVIIAGLDLDYKGVPFGVMPELMAVAERVRKFHAICAVCGAPAARSQRIADSDERVLVGGNTVYEARCRLHWSPRPTFSADRRMEDRED
jgi:thymidine kinase